MTRSELIQLLNDKNPDLTMEDWDRIVDSVFETIQEAMVTGRRVELRGFGAFSVREREARLGRNPKTGEQVDVEAKVIPYFRPGKKLRDRVNDAYVDSFVDDYKLAAE